MVRRITLSGRGAEVSSVVPAEFLIILGALGEIERRETSDLMKQVLNLSYSSVPPYKRKGEKGKFERAVQLFFYGLEKILKEKGIEELSREVVEVIFGEEGKQKQYRAETKEKVKPEKVEETAPIVKNNEESEEVEKQPITVEEDEEVIEAEKQLEDAFVPLDEEGTKEENKSQKSKKFRIDESKFYGG
jgi:hypothetical protein